MRPINLALLAVARRAERVSSSQLVASFVDVGALSASVATRDHQVIYGRRGTGKTHVLSFLGSGALRGNDIVINVDLRTLGSTGGIYADYNLPLPERATRLISDLLWAVHDGLMAHAIEDESTDYATIQNRLDELRDAISEVKVIGEETESVAMTETNASSSRAGMTLALAPASTVAASVGASRTTSTGDAVSRSVVGQSRCRVHFGNVSRRLNDTCTAFRGKTVWLLLDEWSEVPFDLQPYLADLLRRTVFPVSSIVVKIAAIEQRTNFRIADDAGGYIGIEIGADAAASLTLDDFMVFDNNAEMATAFFKTLLWKHVTSAAEVGSNLAQLSETDFTSETFTQINALQELVRAAEGVPRDAINVAALAAQSAADRHISVADVRAAARQWYQQSKESAVASRNRANDLLHWIREKVIGSRRARAFLLPSDARSDLIDFLYDSRVLHVIKKGVSSHDTPGVRYNVYAIDYGCYVDLISTTNAPAGLFEIESADEGGVAQFAQVPVTDYRSIRRAILDLNEFNG